MIWWIVINWSIEVWSLIAYEVHFVIQPQLPFLYWTVFLNVIRVLDPEGDHINDRSLLNKIPSFSFFLPDWGSILHYCLACFYRQKEAVANIFDLKLNQCLHSKVFAVLSLSGLTWVTHCIGGGWNYLRGTCTSVPVRGFWFCCLLLAIESIPLQLPVWHHTGNVL